MHRDYSPDGCASQVQVTMYGDRIEILSPGGLCRAMTVDRLGELGVSFPRNQALANILRATPYAEGFAEVGSVVENKGTGYFQIRASLREANMPEPVASLTTSPLSRWRCTRPALARRQGGSGSGSAAARGWRARWRSAA
ncbi:MAG: ATP-binding protein [Adlercreutzia equolifaciens]